MACYHPLKAWRLPSGAVVLREPSSSVLDAGHTRSLRLPCGNCIGCRTDKARHLALRCALELREHPYAAFVTLTYADKYLPPTLRKADLSAYLKRLREDVKPTRFRFFASGEYGDRFGRPHYHAILFGLSPELHAGSIVDAWGLRVRSKADPRVFEHRPFGIVDVDKVTPRVISYVAGYCSKKLGWKSERGKVGVDPETGEEFEYEPPFVHFSRGGRTGKGLAAKARDTYPESWRKFAVVGGAKCGVPRYLHNGWRSTASDSDILELEAEKAANARHRTRDELRQGERNALARHKLASTRRANG